ncbi:MAG: GNAT family N-acetyltransferase [Rhodospirillales bacterium]|nr:GNAT family N-acetyltransferase [Rhodospirillales bacterium]
MSGNTTTNIRLLKPEDLERVVDIDTRITGRSRRKFFEKRLEAALADTRGFVAVGLEGSSGELIGLAIARIQNGEYGVDKKSAVLDVIGVDPDAQHDGGGQALLEGIIGNLRKLGIGELRTQVEWSNQRMTHFFASAGFELANEQVLERPVSRNL